MKDGEVMFELALPHLYSVFLRIQMKQCLL